MIAVVSKLWLMSLQACVVILIVLAARFFLKKYPKGYSYLLWAAVGLRLLCPLWIEMPAGSPGIFWNVQWEEYVQIDPSAQNAGNAQADQSIQNPGNVQADQFMQNVGNAQMEQSAQGTGNTQMEQSAQGTGNTQMEQSAQNTGNVQAEQSVQNTGNTQTNQSAQNPGTIQSSQSGEKTGTVQTDNKEADSAPAISVLAGAGGAQLYKVLTILYLAGAVALAVVYGVQYLLLKKRIATAVRHKDNIWFCEKISTPFVMGVFRPQIYLPYGLDAVSRRYVLKHEKTHIRHHDPIIRMIGILCLCLHWWNPLVWLAVHLMNQDMEMSCDEGFLLHAPTAERKAYANALLAFAQKRSGLWVELAFGETHTERRIKNILARKKEGAVSVIIAVLVLILCGCSFLTETPEGSGDNGGSFGSIAGGENTQDEDLLNPDAGNGEDMPSPDSDAGNGEDMPSHDGAGGNQSYNESGNAENDGGTASPENEADPYCQLYGTWEIYDFIPGTVYALSNAQIEAILYTKLEYSADTFRRSQEGTVQAQREINAYSMETLSGEQLAEEFGMSAEALGVAGRELQYYAAEWDDTDLLGAFFYRIDGDNALVYYEGVFFRAERVWYTVDEETASQAGGNQEFTLTEEGKAFLQSMCYYMPDWGGYASIDEAFWETFLFNSFTSPAMLENGKVMTICGEAEVVSVYREDLGYEESQVKISREQVAEYTKLAMGCEPLHFEPALEDMEKGQTALYYADGYYYIGFSDFGSVGYTFKDFEIFEEQYTTYATVRFDVYFGTPDEVSGTVEFMLYPANNRNGFTIIDKTYSYGG